MAEDPQVGGDRHREVTVIEHVRNHPLVGAKPTTALLELVAAILVFLVASQPTPLFSTAHQRLISCGSGQAVHQGVKRRRCVYHAGRDGGSFRWTAMIVPMHGQQR